MVTNTQAELSAEELAQIERKYDTESAFRPMGPRMGMLISIILAAMSVYHFYASGFA